MVSGTPEEQVHAEKVYNLLSRGKHWVLVTLLVGNVIVNETLPVVLDSELGGGILAIVISTILIVVFGEIIPQAVCARYGLAIGSFCAKPMLIFMYITSPVSYPIAMLLDACLGVHHGTTYKKAELKTLVSLHQLGGIGDLTDDEVTIIASVLDLKDKPVSIVMTPLEDVFTLSEDAILDEALMEEIVSAGYSRIPIYRRDDEHNFIGMLLVKRLITYDPEDHVPVREFPINSLPQAAPNTSCLDILNFFQEGRSHMAMVTSEPNGYGVPIGVITLEDVIEELLGEEIVDESDVYVDVHNKIRVVRRPTKNANMIRSLKTLLQSPALSASTPLLGTSLDRHTSHGGVTSGGGGGGGGSVTGGVDAGYKSTGNGKTILSRRNTATRNSPFLKSDILEDHKKPDVVVEAMPSPTVHGGTTVAVATATNGLGYEVHDGVHTHQHYPEGDYHDHGYFNTEANQQQQEQQQQEEEGQKQLQELHHHSLVHFDDHVRVQPISPAPSRSPQAADGTGAVFEDATDAVEIEVDPSAPMTSVPEHVHTPVVTAAVVHKKGGDDDKGGDQSVVVAKERALVVDVPERDGGMYPIPGTTSVVTPQHEATRENERVLAESKPLLVHSESTASVNTNTTNGSSGSGGKKTKKKKKKSSK
ncbi:hypothetical protein DFQ27_007234 [Actinomortierella ambigua]|uniref:DUF21-domain-containing protein n=1 Tax=Actinomortierella ambigua TaxID=1343610 RepID=A0A9P6PU91_9FUNG|nr:hypothetical protein DFQ27_007234 [Actinomortierella ambigua]